ncbi:CRISPR-associated endoribonuclease Cas6 [Tepiditoga spiralis]|uniref:CRISPR-associated endoribonuclease Cas6 n=1 Tax=Tepiditoga spiralis TaxID=2108365 RepID=A0A7G1G4M8_9BACT|nr:CRISPR-associated endoribonuclease Cas6 [Tepiditoga spiralis]BBE29974.1 CRISPR-associated endoribonuclease Cas6 [Tepiditoga spiralis]
MRFRLFFELENKEMPLDYRRIFMSFIKKSFTEKDVSILKKYYNEKDSIQKHFSFGINFGKCKFENQKIKMENNKFFMVLSSFDNEFAINFYNSILNMKTQKFPLPNSNSMTLFNISLEKEKWINKNEIYFKIMSPVIIRKHEKKDNKDFYYTLDNKESINILKENIKYTLLKSEYNNLVKYVDNLKIDIVNFKKTIVLNYSAKIPVTLGVIKVKGNEMILDYLYKSGIGSKRSNGFGLVEIL